MAFNKSRIQANILVAEDNPADVFLIREALKSIGSDYNLEVRNDGEQLIDFMDRLEAEGLACPDIVLLDLNLPRRNGHDLLRHIRQNSKCRDIPVVIVTSSDSPRDRAVASALGANYYFRKPCDFYEFMSLGAVVEILLEGSPAH